MRPLPFLLLVLAWGGLAVGGPGAKRPDPPGPHVKKASSAVLARSSFGKDQPVVGTYYFYWFDVNTGEHFVDRDGTDALTDHPERSDGYSYRFPEWHLRELRDILDARIDFVLPVYWGYPDDYQSWSFTGLKALVEACRRLQKEKKDPKAPPRIGLFYDTSTLRFNRKGFHADLSTSEGKEWLYVSARDFFSLIPHDLWATVEGRPLLWLYSAGFAKRQDPTALDYLRVEFEKDFGVRPFVVKEVSWQGQADATYAWGAALNPRLLDVSAVGPGYDHSAVPGRAPLIRDREGGAFYCRSWELALSRNPAKRPSIAVVETWNELHEGTEIAPTKEYGRQYVELTAKYADLWHAGKRLQRSGPFAKAKEISAELGESNREKGLLQREPEDGKTRPVFLKGQAGRETVTTRHGGRYIYFDVHESFYSGDSDPLEVEFVFFDRGKGSVVLEYDSHDETALLQGAFKAAARVSLGDTQTWRTQRTKIRDASFTGRANGSDFRLSFPGGHSALARVSVRKAGADPLTYYVATNGQDGWSGKLPAPNETKTDGPFATLLHARDVIRRLRKVARLPVKEIQVVVRGGRYIVDRPLDLTAEDSALKDAPLSFRAQPGETTRILGGKTISRWERVTDPAVLKRLDASARGKVMQADLKALGIDDFGTPAVGGKELFFGGVPMTVSRWPNEGFARVVNVHGKTERNVRGTKGCAEGIFEYQDYRPKRWVGEKDAWVHGYWFWDWAEQRHKIKSIDTEKRRIEVEPPYHGYGYRKGQWFYGFNLLSEIDRAGEWTVDRERGVLYFWPPAPVEKSEAIVSVAPNLIRLKDAFHVTLRGLTLEGACGTAITVTGGRSNRVVGCTVRNVGSWAVQVSGGSQHGVVGCDMYNMGRGGISLSGGDRKTLTPAGHFAENNHIHHYARVKRVYQPGITLGGVGNRAAHNLIHNAPHMGIGFGGNDHLIEFNEIHSVCYESNDAGAIYTGRNWTMRGTVIRNNYLHHINGFEGRGCVGVYLDDMFCGTEISGNLFYRVTRAAFIGGGRDCVVSNNLFVDCKPALHIDARALGWAKYHAETWVKEGREKGTLSGIRYQEPPYSERYPQLVNILNEEPGAPRGNKVFHNVSFGGKWDGVHGGARKYQSIEKNLIDKDPHFATPERIGEGKAPRAVDFELKADSPAWAVGFKKLPLDRIGLMPDDSRASWPVSHQVRQ